MVDVLNRDQAMQDSVTPTGRQLGVVLEKQFGLYRVEYIDKKGGLLPSDLAGRYTKGAYARDAIQRYLKEQWDMNDAAVVKAARKAHKEKVLQDGGEEDQPTGVQ